MKRTTWLFLLVVTSCFVKAQSPSLDLIPWPAEVNQVEKGSYLLKSMATVSSDFPEWYQERTYRYLLLEMKKRGITIKKAANNQKADIRFEMRRMPTSGKPAYRLIVDESGIVISSNFEEPAFHGVQTLLQLLPLQPATGSRPIPWVQIFDHARFEYRGMHFDVGRHFSSVAFVKKYIDYLAYHKLNRFHWHLTEDQGWRIEIKKYPELTNTGSWRNGTIIGRYPGTGSTNTRYGGFYTQEEIRDVVKYANDRFIDVIPEIEMPGHSSAAIASYPWLSCFPSRPTAIPAKMISAKSVEEQKNGRIKLVQETWGVFDDVFCAGNDSTFVFLQNVIDEVTALFPSRYFHIGGDECPKTHWKQCPKCQQRMKEHNLKDEHELQSYFVQRMEKYLNSKGKILIGWDEILEGGLAPNAVVMSWRGEKGGIEAAKQKHQVIMTPGNPVYFDHTQSEAEDSVTIGGYNPIDKVYAYEPIPKELSEEEGKYILGAQANLWTEYISNPKKVEYMIFPRMSALSEVLWTPKEKRNWNHFEQRLPVQMKRYDSWNANYSTAYYELRSTISPTPDNKGLRLVIKSRGKGNYYQGEFKKPVSAAFNNSIKREAFLDSVTVIVDTSIQYVGQLFSDKDIKKAKKIGAISLDFSFNKATGKKITLKEPASPSYPGEGAFTLVNGIINTKGFARTREFLGWSGKDCEAVIDLGSQQDIRHVLVNALMRRTSWIWEPAGAEVYASPDGESWSQLKPVDGSMAVLPPTGSEKYKLNLYFQKIQARFVKVIVKNKGVIPEGNAGAGNKAWLFVDEIEIQ